MRDEPKTKTQAPTPPRPEHEPEAPPQMRPATNPPRRAPPRQLVSLLVVQLLFLGYVVGARPLAHPLLQVGCEGSWWGVGGDL